MAGPAPPPAPRSLWARDVTSRALSMRTTTVPHKGAFEAQEVHMGQAQKSRQEVSTSALSLMWGWPSSLWSAPRTHPPHQPYLRIQSLRRTPPNGRLQKEGSLNTLVLKRAIWRIVKPALLGLVPHPTSWGERLATRQLQGAGRGPRPEKGSALDPKQSLGAPAAKQEERKQT